MPDELLVIMITGERGHLLQAKRGRTSDVEQYKYLWNISTGLKARELGLQTRGRDVGGKGRMRRHIDECPETLEMDGERRWGGCGGGRALEGSAVMQQSIRFLDGLVNVRYGQGI